MADTQNDPVNHPKHYTSHPSGVECIQVTEHMGFNLGNAVKYIWRADLKADAIEDLKKAKWYIERELIKRGADEYDAKELELAKANDIIRRCKNVMKCNDPMNYLLVFGDA